jgi:pimeloyl-ACP methyl ester carboxylesterase
VALELAFTSTGSGPPLLILHGLFGSGGNWRSVARGLSATHQVLCVDLRNHGASPWADSMAYAEMAGDVLRVIEREQLLEPVVMGHSMGGKTAMALALLHPQVVSRLILVDIAPLAYADRLSPFAEAMRGIDMLAAGSRSEIQQRLAMLVPDPSAVPFLMQNLVSRNSHFDWRINLTGIAASIRQLSDFPAELRGLQFKGPVHVIAGGRSDYVEHRDGRDYQPMFPKLEVDVIDSAGHWVHADEPQRFLALVSKALSAA